MCVCVCVYSYIEFILEQRSPGTRDPGQDLIVAA